MNLKALVLELPPRRAGNKNQPDLFLEQRRGPVVRRFRILIGITLILCAIAYGLGHYMDRQGIKSQSDAEVIAQEKIEKSRTSN